MDWTNDFYSQTGEWWGNAESKIEPRDYHRLKTLERLTKSGPKNVLELGSSYGNTAAVMAQAGHNVVGVEISDRIKFAHKYEEKSQKGSLQFIRADFYTVTLDQKFDAICYWNGFGIGSDADQRELLKRMSHQWLKSDGTVLMDVANPTCWINWTGDREQLAAAPDRGYHYNVSQYIDFDPIHGRFVDTWWETDKPELKLSQDIRCYAPSDFLLLLEGTGLRLDTLEVDGQPLDMTKPATSAHPLWNRNEYLVKLLQDGSN